MVKINKKLARLESVYQVAREIDPVYVSDFIHYVFENKELFNLAGEGVTEEWLGVTPKAFEFVDNMLRLKGFVVSEKSILEGLNIFKSELLSYD